jgi:hypothetical protein
MRANPNEMLNAKQRFTEAAQAVLDRAPNAAQLATEALMAIKEATTSAAPTAAPA